LGKPAPHEPARRSSSPQAGKIPHPRSERATNPGADVAPRDRNERQSHRPAQRQSNRQEGKPAERLPGFLTGLVVVLLLLRFWLMTLPGYPPDLNTYKGWALRGGLRGVHTIYDEGSSYDYPPLYGYLLAPCGKCFSWVYSPEDLFRPSGGRSAGRTRAMGSAPTTGAGGGADVGFGTGAATDAGDGRLRQRAATLLSLLVKIPPLAFDIGLAALLGLLVARYRMWGSTSSWRGWKPALIYLAHPAVLCVSAYWGQPDAVETFFVLLALIWILTRRPELGWTAAALGLLMKPLAAPFFPLLALATLIRSGWKRLLSGGAACLLTIAAGFMPFFLTGRTRMVLDRFVSDIEAMPYTSVNGHNLWWLLGAWRPANDGILGPLTPKQLALGAFGLAYLFILWWTWQRERSLPRAGPAEAGGEAPRPSGSPSAASSAGACGSRSMSFAKGWPPLSRSRDAHWFAAAFAVALSFFALATHMHENHLFPAIALGLVLAGSGRPWAILNVVVGAAVLINCVTHDLVLGDLFLSKVGGPSPRFAADIDWYLRLPPNMTVDWTLSRGPYFSWLELTLTYVNSVLIVGTWGFLMAFLVRSRRQRTD
jgi:hypothetical protein